MAKKTTTTDAGADNAGTTTDVVTLSPEEQAAQALSYEDTKAKLSALAKESVSLVRVDTDDSLAAAKSAYLRLRSTRTSIEKTGKAARDGATKFQRAVIAKEKELIQVIQPEETRLDGLIEAENLRRAEAERAAKEAEQKRAEAIANAFGRVRSLPALAESLHVEGIDRLIAEAEALRDDPSQLPEDLQAAARYEANVAINACKAVRDRRIQADKDAEELAEFRRQRAAAAASQLVEASSSIPTVAAPLDEDDIPPPVNLRRAPFVAEASPPPPASRTLLSAAVAALELFREQGLGGHPVVLDLSEAIDDERAGGAS